MVCVPLLALSRSVWFVDPPGCGTTSNRARYLRYVRYTDALCDRRRYQRRAPFHLRSEEHTSELQSLMRISYAVFFLKKKKTLIRTIFAYSTTRPTSQRFCYTTSRS